MAAETRSATTQRASPRRSRLIATDPLDEADRAAEAGPVTGVLLSRVGPPRGPRGVERPRAGGSPAAGRRRARPSRRSRAPELRSQRRLERDSDESAHGQRPARSGSFDEPAMPQGKVDEGPERVVMVRAAGEVLTDQRLDAGRIEMDAHHLGSVEQL